MKKLLTISVVSMTSILLLSNVSSSLKTVNSNEGIVLAKKKKNNYRKKSYIIDKIVKKNITDNPKKVSTEEYNNFTKKKLTLDGVIAKYGAPTHYIGGSKGDTQIEVTFPTDEKGYSVDLTFKYHKKSVFGSHWLLKKKFVVESKGIEYSKYKKQKGV